MKTYTKGSLSEKVWVLLFLKLETFWDPRTIQKYGACPRGECESTIVLAAMLGSLLDMLNNSIILAFLSLLVI